MSFFFNSIDLGFDSKICLFAVIGWIHEAKMLGIQQIALLVSIYIKYLPVFARLDEVEKRLRDEAEYPGIAEYSQRSNQQFDEIYQYPEQSNIQGVINNLMKYINILNNKIFKE